jgi:hypothetical protein
MLMRSLRFRGQPVVRLLGYCPDSPADVLAQVAAGVKPSGLKGDFVLIAEGVDEATGRPQTVFVSTVVSAVPYFFHADGESLSHASNVFECCEKAGIPWRWNYRAIAQLALFDHVITDESMHADIRRVPQASVLRFCDGKLECHMDSYWHDRYLSPRHDAKVDDGVGLILQLLGELPSERGHTLSLSAGYDSRLLLAGLMHLKRDVTSASMGHEHSTDSRVAAQLAQAAGIPFRRLEIVAIDYIKYARGIVTTTSGEKTFSHWHTGIYSERVGFDPAAWHLAGSNGEICRSYYFDKGWQGLLLQWAGVRAWPLRLRIKHSIRFTIPRRMCDAIEPTGEFRKHLSTGRYLREACVRGPRFLDGLEMFYASHRVRYFIGLGLALYRHAFPTMSPFLDVRFIDYVSRLPHSWKMASRFHRSMIVRLYPQLADFPTDDTRVPMSASPGPFYYRRHHPFTSYNPLPQARDLPQVREWSREGLKLLGAMQSHMDSDASLERAMERWDLPITLGALSDTLTSRGIPMAAG